MTTSGKPKLLTLVRIAIRSLNYSFQTEKNYVYWIKHYIRFHNLRHPKDMGGAEINEFLTYLAAKQCTLLYLLDR